MLRRSNIKSGTRGFYFRNLQHLQVLKNATRLGSFLAILAAVHVTLGTGRKFGICQFQLAVLADDLFRLMLMAAVTGVLPIIAGILMASRTGIAPLPLSSVIDWEAMIGNRRAAPAFGAMTRLAIGAELS